MGRENFNIASDIVYDFTEANITDLSKHSFQ
jgi:hypothetical protein